MDYFISNQVGDNEAWYPFFDGDWCEDRVNRLQRNSDFVKSHLDSVSTDGNESAKITLKLIPTEINNSPIYAGKGELESELGYCLRFGVYIGDHSTADSTDGNYRETPVLHLTGDIGSNLTVGGTKA
jgi:hypothetical protein